MPVRAAPCESRRLRGRAEPPRRRALGSAAWWESSGWFRTRCPMAQASRSGGPLPPLATVPPFRAQPGGAEEEQWQRRRAGALLGDVRGWPGLPVARSIRCQDPRPDGAPKEQPWWVAPADAGEHSEAGAVGCGRDQLAPGGLIPPALRRLRAVLLRLQREREQLLQARDCALRLQAAVRFLRILSPGAPSPSHGPLLQLCRDLLQHLSGGAVLRSRLLETPSPLLLARPVGLAAQRLDATVEMRLRALGRAPATPALSSQLADLLLALPAYHQLQGKAFSQVPASARPYPPGRVLRLLTGERGCQVAGWLDEALRGSGLRDQLLRRCQEERELLPGLPGLLGGVTGSASSELGLGGAGALWSQYWTLLWAACAQSLDLSLGPWRDPRAAAQQLSQALGQASLPQECEKELASLCRILIHQSLIRSWDQGEEEGVMAVTQAPDCPFLIKPYPSSSGFCQVLGSASGNRSSHPSSSCTTKLLQQLFPPLLDALREPRSGLLLCGPGPAPLALGLCTLQTTLLWFWSRTQQHLAAWAPGSFLFLIQKELPPLLQEAEALSRLVSEESLALDVEQQLGLEIQKLTVQIQLLPEESLSLFFQECHKQATQDFELHMPRELPSIPSEYAGLVVRRVLEPVLQGLHGLPPQAQASALSQALTAILGAWLDHILSHGIRFSLQGALQLRQDFGVVRDLLEEEQWGLSPELRQSLFMLSIFQRLDGALLCLLQQPLPKTQVHRGLPRCCACNEVQTMELPSSSLNSLESLEPPLQPGVFPTQTAQLLSTLWGGGLSPEAYLVGNQQAWLALRQHQHPRWHLSFLSCLGTSSES
ncbi:coiled-coil domain-containing protein 142 isoform X2 [Moschus berezovskii]|uniref:coiled-coil domain-containing protein 142 isoform X2 n=1 Tax=Moschus berezovskii TaxID=68408 RepID=UPI002443EAA5|nr:coiled-coil domain-containing protein 142 isoform X2 [Moschus berezovskii]